jgi:hypothetical protein
MKSDLIVAGSMNYFWMLLEVALVSLLCFVAAIIAGAKETRRAAVFWMIVIIGSIFMTLEVSRPIWSNIEYLQALQFPYRFNAIISLATLPLILTVFSIRPVRWYLIVAILIVTGSAMFWTYDLVKVASHAYRPIDGWKVNFDNDLNRLQLEVRGRWPSSVPLGAYYGFDQALAKIPAVDGQRARAYFQGGQGTVSVSRWRPRDIGLQAESPNGGTMVVTQFNYPGWRAKDTNSGEAFPITSTADLGLIAVAVPPGFHEVELQLEELWPEYLAEWLSVISLALVMGLFVWLGYSRASR